MSRATATDHAASQGAEAGTEHAPDLEAEHDPQVARRASLAGLRREAAVQQKGGAGASSDEVHAAAERGIDTPATALPHADRIQASFGPGHDVSKIKAHVGSGAPREMGATAYASGDHVVFEQEPDLHTAAHEAAHVVQQAQGVNLYGGVGAAGDAYEQQADAVADRVVAGESASDLLGGSTAGAASAGGAVQQKAKLSDATPRQQEAQRDKAKDAGVAAVEASLRLGTAQIHMHAAITNAVNEEIKVRRTDAEVWPQVSGVVDRYMEVKLAVSHLQDGLSLLSSGDCRGLQGDVLRFAGAVSLFVIAWDKVRSYAEGEGQAKAARFEGMPGYELNKKVDDGIYKLCDIPPGTLCDRSPGKDKLDKVQKGAMSQVVQAVQETARAVRMGLGTGQTEALIEDLKKMIWQLGQVLTIAEQSPKGAVAAPLRSALQVARAVQREIPARPELGALASELGFKIKHLQKYVSAA